MIKRGQAASNHRSARRVFTAGWQNSLFVLTLAICTTGSAAADATRQPLVDALSATYLVGPQRVLVGGSRGDLAELQIADQAEVVKLQLIADTPSTNFTAMVALSDDEALVGSSDGRVFSYRDQALTQLAELSDFQEPVLDLLVRENDVWAVGARGLLARSADGHTWETVEIARARQPEIVLPNTAPGSWYFGIANVDPESVVFTGNVGGKPAKQGTDYTFYAEEGFLQITNELDAQPVPAISFSFVPGPPFRLGDVSWNTILEAQGGVTLAGEFGLILQSGDDGATWVRRNAQIFPGETQAPYWLAGTSVGSNVVLAGAAGVLARSDDGGVTWQSMPSPGKEGIFGVRFMPDSTVAVLGAVGLAGIYSQQAWQLADRSRLLVYSWLRHFIELPDRDWLVLGGRSIALRFDGTDWQRLKMIAATP